MNYVDAIEEGKIVRVSEEYAKQEGLFILKKVEQSPISPQATTPSWKRKEKDESRMLFDDFRKPLRAKDQLAAELIDNFHWTLLEKRKSKNMTRKQLAGALGVSELDIKSVENGILPTRDLVLINKLEKYYEINLRKSGINYQESYRKKTTPSEKKYNPPTNNQTSSSVNSSSNNKPRDPKQSPSDDSTTGSDIEIF